MNSKSLLLSFITSLSFTCAVSAQVAIVDSSHALGNGSFEFDSAGAVQVDADGDLKTDLPPGQWQAGDLSALEVFSDPILSVQGRSNKASEGNFSMSVGGSSTDDVCGGILNTGYLVSEGDRFELSFDWRDATGWKDAYDHVAYALFTSSDDTLSGDLSVLATGSFLSENKKTFDTVTASVASFSSDHIGRQLWLAIAREELGDGHSYAYVDNVNLSVSQSVAGTDILISSAAVGTVETAPTYSADFEGPDYTAGVLVSDPEWNFDADALTVEIDATDAASGVQSLSLTGASTFDYDSAALVTPSQILWLDVNLQPAYASIEDLPLSFGVDRTAVNSFVQIDAATGELYAVDGDGLGGGQWLATGSTTSLNAGAAEDWLRLTYRLDYSTSTWDIFVDGEMVAVDLGFLDATAAYFKQFTLRGDESVASGLDSFSLSANNPMYADTSGDGLPDSWLLSHGLDVNINQRSLDLDADGLTTLMEYLHATLPTDADSDGDGLMDGDELLIGLNPNLHDVDGASGIARRDVWTDIGDSELTSLTKRAGYPTNPNETYWTLDLDISEADSLGGNYGQRIYGRIIAPDTADYTFWIAGDDQCEFWLSDDSSSFNKELVVSSYRSTGYQEWGAQSNAIRLEAGQAYFFEILHKQRGAAAHVSVAWAYGTQPIAIIDSEHLQASAPEAGDLDQDGLPDDWELANGLSASKGNGVNGYAGDLDGDGILNYQERQLGTNPSLADSDGDGYSDYEELYQLYSDPTTQDLSGEPVVVSTVSGSDFTSTRGSWSAEGTELYSVDSTGAVSYALNFPDAGAYRLIVELTEQNAYKGTTSTFEIRATLDGNNCGIQSVSVNYGDTAELSYGLPYLDAGTRELQLDWLNGFRDAFLRIRSVRLERIDGLDVDQNGIADWIETRAAKFGSEAALPLEIYASPFCFEGTSFAPASAVISSHPVSDAASLRDEAVQPALTNSYYADIELLADQDRVVLVNDQSGLRTSQYTLTWAAFNAVIHDFYHIRLDDSMLLTAIDSSLPQARPISLQLTAPDGAVETHSLAAEARLQARFDQVGDWQLQATLLPLTDEDPIVYDSVIRVSSASLAPAPIIFENTARSWSPSISDLEVDVESGAALPLYEPNPDLMPRNFELNGSLDGGRIIARLPDGGAILSITETKVIRDYSRIETYNDVVETFSDGTVMVSAYILLNEVPEGLSLDLKVVKSGLVFDDGTTQRTISAEDFDEQGRYRFHLLRAPGVDGGNCYRYTFEQDDVEIGGW